MAEKKTAEATVKAYDPEELVTYTRPLDLSGKELDLVVGVNGKIIRIRSGETVQIQRKFLEVIEHAEQQKMEALLARRRAKQASRAPMAEL